jgi:hypothetical protein
MLTKTAALKLALTTPLRYAEAISGLHLRRYQEQVANAIVDSVRYKKGLTFVVIFPRQSGKNELQAQIESYIMTVLAQRPAEIVKVSPTWKPQSLNAMRRLERVLKHNYFADQIPQGYVKESGYIFRLGSARIYFLSASPTANIVGATASTLLEADEAQDIQTAKWDKEVNPMAASTNATRVFWGTAWTSQTLLAREMRAALEAQKQDGIQRLFKMTADEVGAEVPAYKEFVRGEIARMGRNHPFVRTQFFSEEIDAEGGMFPPSRIALLRGSHHQIDVPLPGRDHIYAFLIDVGGEDKDATPDPAALTNTHDSTVLTCVWVDLSTLVDPALQGPTYRVIWRKTWVGASQTTLYAQIRSLAEHWQPRRIIIDATGIGAGLASNLEHNYGITTVVPFIFTSKSKSDLAWNFIAQIETGRYKEYSPLDETLYRQLITCKLEILPGPARLCRWAVPDGTRNPQTGELIHDDLLLSAALCSELDCQVWGTAQSLVIQPHNPLAELTF